MSGKRAARQAQASQAKRMPKDAGSHRLTVAIGWLNGHENLKGATEPHRLTGRSLSLCRTPSNNSKRDKQVSYQVANVQRSITLSRARADNPSYSENVIADSHRLTVAIGRLSTAFDASSVAPRLPWGISYLT